MSYVPRLKEEEALLLSLRVLAGERKGQATVREIKEVIEGRKLRAWSDHDAAGNTLRSGAPMWHQIVQNASDRLDEDRHFYRASFVTIVSSSPHKVLKITDNGRRFVDDLQIFEKRLLGDGFKLYEYLDETPLAEGEAWSILKKKLAKIPYESGNERDDLLRSLRSTDYAAKHHENYETAGLHTKILVELKRLSASPLATSVDAWMTGRAYVGDLANAQSKRESLLARLKLQSLNF